MRYLSINLSTIRRLRPSNRSLASPRRTARTRLAVKGVAGRPQDVADVHAMDKAMPPRHREEQRALPSPTALNGRR